MKYCFSLYHYTFKYQKLIQLYKHQTLFAAYLRIIFVSPQHFSHITCFSYLSSLSLFSIFKMIIFRIAAHRVFTKMVLCKQQHFPGAQRLIFHHHFDPLPFNTTSTVFRIILISIPTFQFLMYSISSFTTSSKSVISLLPLTCHIPVSPGFTASLAR